MVASRELPSPEVDVVMLGSFSAWRLGTLQARALPLAIELREHGVRCAIVTSPWDQPAERGVVDSISGVMLRNTRSASTTLPAAAVAEQLAVLRALRPKLVHVFKPRGFGGLAGALTRSAPVLVDCDDWEGDGGWNRHGRYSLAQRRLFDWQERSMIRSATAVTAASTLLAHRARALRRGRGGVRLAPNGLRTKWLEQLAAGRASAGATPSVVLYSRFEEFPADWPARFASALDRDLAARAEFRLVGNRHEIADNGRNHLELQHLGYVARSDLSVVLGSSVVAVVPYQDSLITRSKSSVKLLELMAAGCAVVASDVGDNAPTLGPTGVLVKACCPEAMAHEVATLLNSTTTARQLGLAAQGRVRDRFSATTIARTVLAEYTLHARLAG